MIVAITGGTGFIGKKLAQKHLNMGDEVRILSRRKHLPSELSRAKVYSADLVNIEKDDRTLQSFFDGVEVFYHCAGEIKDENKMVALHIDGTQRLVECAKGRVKRWVQLSSTGVYGSIYKGVVTEATPYNPVGVYEETKLASDKIVQQAYTARYFEAVFLQPAAVIGVDMPNQSLYQLIKLVYKGWVVFLGKENAIFNYIHVDNVVDALYLCGLSKGVQGESFILSESITLKRFFSIVVNRLKVKVRIISLPLWIAKAAAFFMQWNKKFPLTKTRILALTSQSVYSSNKIQKMLGYQTKVCLDDAIDEMAKKVVEP